MNMERVKIAFLFMCLFIYLFYVLSNDGDSNSDDKPIGPNCVTNELSREN